MKLGQDVIDACLAMGFALAGVAPAEPSSRRDEYLAWLRAGKHGDMAYLEEHLEERLDVTRLLPGARAVIVVADQYARAGDADAAVPPGDGPTGLVARYARGRDYHRAINKRLHALCDRLRERWPGARFRAFVDSGPALEREHAVRAGLGQGGGRVFAGKHTLVIHPRLGSWLLLGGVATTLEIASPEPAPAAGAGADRCGTCTRCIDACPTGAIAPGGWSVDATRCVSYLTLEHRGAVDASLHAGMGDRLVGCDVCQDVCPYNAAAGGGAAGTGVNPAYADPEGVRARLPLLEVLGWTPEDRSRVLSGTAAKRASLEMLRRSAVIGLGNALAERWDEGVAARLREAALEAGVVGETARRVLSRLSEAVPAAGPGARGPAGP